MNATEKMEITSQGAHQLALRRRSVKVLLGAMKVFTMRAPCDNGTVPGVGSGYTGAAAIRPPGRLAEKDCSRLSGEKQDQVTCRDVAQATSQASDKPMVRIRAPLQRCRNSNRISYAFRRCGRRPTLSAS